MPLKFSPERMKGRFINPHAKAIRRSFFDVLLWKMGFYDDVASTLPIPKDFSFPMPERILDKEAPSVLWVNHNTFVIRMMGLTFLTDPIWSKRCSPLSFLGPKRQHPPSITLEGLKNVNYVLISHNHYDHLDKKTVRRLQSLYPQITWIVPTGVRSWFTKLGIHNVIELSWWEEVTLKTGANRSIDVTITSTPCQHFSGRKISDFNKTLWSGWVVQATQAEKTKRFYFVGDTGYNPYDFKAVGHKWQSMDLSLIPIGCYSPRIFMAPVHTDPIDAIRIHKEVGSTLSVAMHWKTFKLSDEGMMRPPFDLYMSLQEEKIDPNTFLAPVPGYEINW